MEFAEKHKQDSQLEQIPTNVEDAKDLEKTIQVDTLHNDEAVKVLASYDGPQEWTPQEEKKLVRKIDLRLLALLVLTYGLQYYDKAMLSQAVRAIYSMYKRDLADWKILRLSSAYELISHSP